MSNHHSSSISSDPTTSNQSPEPNHSSRQRERIIAVIVVAIGAVLLSVLILGRFSFAYLPVQAAVLNPEMAAIDEAYDLWGQSITTAEAESLLATEQGRQALSPANGAVQITNELVQLGRETFYQETFNSERFFTDVVGWLEGGIRLGDYISAIVGLAGRGTDNLQVRLSRDVTVGGQTFEQGTVLNTGLDVAPGSLLPMGAQVSYDRGRIRLGLTCAVCHSAFDPVSGEVVDGVTNQNLNAGLILAMASNSAAYFTHTGVDVREMIDGDEVMTLPDGTQQALPDRQALEDAVDAELLAWPPGSFDTTTDLVNNPVRVPDSFTRGDHPFAWTGNQVVGPFRGLSTLNNNVFTVGADTLSDAETIAVLYDLDPEEYRAIVLRNASYDPIRYDPATETRPPSELIEAQGHWSPIATFADGLPLPTFPQSSLMSLISFVAGTPGSFVWQENNAMSAFQDRLIAPPPPQIADLSVRERGRQVFSSAGCVSCHAGAALTNNTVLPIAEVGTAPTRARSLAAIWEQLAPPQTQSFDTPIPVPEDARVLEVPLDDVDWDQIELAWAADGEGGYKVKGLLGTYWNAPYLHDGGVAVGDNIETEVGVPATLMSNVRVNPANSLLGLIDRQLRDRIIQANREAGLEAVDVQGIGHEHWVDEAAGFSAEDQQALIQYLLWPSDLPIPVETEANEAASELVASN
ncbi:MAG: cytochrome C oxidase Cbb3 [Desertifilum sp. SIO1I2]|nr:cytochrome C oxidase Cbb3 [Desertifilum sp. SIO1I2]